MYIDKQRSWFMHASVHDQRSEGGIQQGATVGVLLDLDRHQLSFYVNEEPQVWYLFLNNSIISIRFLGSKRVMTNDKLT